MRTSVRCRSPEKSLGLRLLENPADVYAVEMSFSLRFEKFELMVIPLTSTAELVGPLCASCYLIGWWERLVLAAGAFFGLWIAMGLPRSLIKTLCFYYSMT